ncbi:MAG: diguanylate cyclase [Terriglobia bacterium]
MESQYAFIPLVGQTGSLEEILGQTLEQLLAVLKLQLGTIAVLGPEGQPRAYVHRGLPGSLLREWERRGLLAHLHHVVARLGGLLVVPDLRRKPPATLLGAQTAGFEQLLTRAREDGVQALVGVSLRAKSGPLGLLALAARNSHRFSPAELRLLLGLGEQLGMVMENFQRVQQSVRRSEALHLLNEIGRVLSSVLNTDELLQRLHAELKKVLDVSNFFVALYDRQREEIAFELEVHDHHRLAKRRRPARKGLIEHLVRTQQPVLICSGFAERMRALGVQPERAARSFCAVPLVSHVQALGVLGVVNHREENAFNEEDLEILRIVAAQTAVALENAWLFTEEQRKTRQLTLLNNISRKAISTLNPEEMLTEIAAEMHTALPYDHIGIGILDYPNREVVIQAEAGHSAQGLNQRIKLGEGCIGEVVMSGRLRQRDTLQSAAEREQCRTILPDARSLLVLPIVYADQMLGVLNVESRKPNAFAEEDVLLLCTLADQLASALHNAFVFQKAQEQAITDGLTGVKTHRFFMEALHAEWRRATRVGRQFSLVLLDLDKFKFINDYYGHLEGDTTLERTGRVLEQNCRRSDVVARYGGDEFVVLMPETNAEQAHTLAEKLRAWLANDPLLHDRKVTASLGLATFPTHAATPQELIQIADASMYLAKHKGGNVVVSAEHYKLSEQKEWQRSVLEAYLGVTIKRLFATGPEAFEELYRHLQYVSESLRMEAGAAGELPPPVLETVTSLAFAIDAKDHYTQGHSQNVARYSVALGRHLGLPEKEVEELRVAAILHDVGKIGIPEHILHKPAPLDPDEFERMKEHVVLGARLLEPLHTIPALQKMVRHQHEHFDGRGYPDGLTGEAIPLGSRIIALADAFDTLVSERTYKRAHTPAEAVAELHRGAGTQFDPKLVKAFVEALAKEPTPAKPVEYKKPRVEQEWPRPGD